jgi:hypothetical protein
MAHLDGSLHHCHPFHHRRALLLTVDAAGPFDVADTSSGGPHCFDCFSSFFVVRFSNTLINAFVSILLS